LQKISSKTIEGVKRALGERNIGGGDLTVALLKKEFLLPVMNRIDAMGGQLASQVMKLHGPMGHFDGCLMTTS
jgi:hypothetical protein